MIFARSVLWNGLDRKLVKRAAESAGRPVSCFPGFSNCYVPHKFGERAYDKEMEPKRMKAFERQLFLTSRFLLAMGPHDLFFTCIPDVCSHRDTYPFVLSFILVTFFNISGFWLF